MVIRKMNSVALALSGNIAAGALILCIAATSSQAAVVYDNFSPGNSYQASSGYTINAATSQGVRFSPSGSGFFSKLTVAIGTDGTPPTPYQMVLFDDVGGAPGAVLETLDFDVTTTFGTNNAPTLVSALGSTFLDVALNYWLVAVSPSGVSSPWMLNTTGDFGFRASNAGGTAGPWSVTPLDDQNKGAFRIEVADIPEPGTLAILGLGLAGLGFARRRQSKPIEEGV